jgi:hypothetical protein
MATFVQYSSCHEPPRDTLTLGPTQGTESGIHARGADPLQSEVHLRMRCRAGDEWILTSRILLNQQQQFRLLAREQLLTTVRVSPFRDKILITICFSSSSFHEPTLSVQRRPGHQWLGLHSDHKKDLEASKRPKLISTPSNFAITPPLKTPANSLSTFPPSPSNFPTDSNSDSLSCASLVFTTRPWGFVCR